MLRRPARHLLGPLTAGLIALGGVACASRGAPLPVERLARLEPRVTHQREVLEWLGPPDAMAVASDGSARWSYRRARGGRAVGALRRWLLAPLGQFFETHVLFPPAPERRAAPAGERLAMAFGPDGRLLSFDYFDYFDYEGGR